MKRWTRLALVVVLALVSAPVQADVVDFLDFSTDGDGAVHTNNGEFVLPNSPVLGGTAPNDWVLTYDPALFFSDETINEFQCIGGVLRVQDWGSEGTITGNWVATEDGTLDVVGVSETLGENAFDGDIDYGPGGILTEGITWFYSINGGAAVTFTYDQAALGGGTISAGTDVSNTFAGIVVSAGDSIDYGATVTVEGEGRGVIINSVEIDFTSAAIPEPSATALLALGLVGLVGRRRR